MNPSARQIRAARELVGMNRKQLAHAAGVSLFPLSQIEAGRIAGRGVSYSRIVAALCNAGVTFTENGVTL